MLQESDLASGRRTQMQRTLAVLQYFDIPKALREEILGFQYHVMEHNFTSAYASVLEGLPSAMQDQLNLYVRIKFISMVPMFQGVVLIACPSPINGWYFCHLKPPWGLSRRQRG